MGRHSQSPSRRDSRGRDRTSQDRDSHSREYKRNDARPDYNTARNDSKRSKDRRQRDDNQYGYGERERERERQKDRGRFDSRTREEDAARPRDRDRDDGYRSARSERRSASPPRRSQPRSTSRSGSKEPPPADKAKPNFAPSGLLAAETNTVKAVDGTKTVLKYNEPPEARKPVLGWRLYVFKGEEQVELLHIHRQSAYLIGRDRLVADISVDHPSCSKQHAVIQYRYVQEKNELGDSKGVVKPFIIDLESTNGTHVNDNVIPPARYYELKASDVIKFGQSTREYVLLHDDAA